MGRVISAGHGLGVDPDLDVTGERQSLDVDDQAPGLGVDPGIDARALILRQREVDVRARAAVERAGGELLGDHASGGRVRVRGGVDLGNSASSRGAENIRGITFHGVWKSL